jgi:glutathione S-transferase
MEAVMILYYVPGACSQACHIALIETGMSYQLNKVGRDWQTQDGQAFIAINAKRYVPALDLADGTILTETLAILTCIADRSGQLLAKDGLDRWRTLEAMAFMTSEIHGNFKPFFRPGTSQVEKDTAGQALVRRFGTIAEQLGDKAFLVGEQMTIADTYLFVMLTWAAANGITVSERLGDYRARMKSQSSVAKALADEGFAS